VLRHDKLAVVSVFGMQIDEAEKRRHSRGGAVRWSAILGAFSQHGSAAVRGRLDGRLRLRTVCGPTIEDNVLTYRHFLRCTSAVPPSVMSLTAAAPPVPACALQLVQI